MTNKTIEERLGKGVLGDFARISTTIPDKKTTQKLDFSREIKKRYYGNIKSLPTDKSPYFILSPGEDLTFLFHYEFYSGTRRLAMINIEEDIAKLNKLVDSKGNEIKILKKDIDFQDSRIFDNAPSNPNKPEWLEEFEKCTQYDLEKVKTYFEGLKQDMQIENNRSYNLVESLATYGKQQKMLNRLEIQLKYYGILYKEITD